MGLYTKLTPTGRFSKSKECSVGVIGGSISHETGQLTNIKLKFFDSKDEHRLTIDENEMNSIIEFWTRERPHNMD